MSAAAGPGLSRRAASGAAMTGVLIRTWKGGDPRLSRPQEKALVAAATSDREARLLGLDDRLRPVVCAKLGLPRETRVYAIQRNGDPTEAGSIAEPWSEKPEEAPWPHGAKTVEGILNTVADRRDEDGGGVYDWAQSIGEEAFWKIVADDTGDVMEFFSALAAGHESLSDVDYHRNIGPAVDRIEDAYAASEYAPTPPLEPAGPLALYFTPAAIRDHFEGDDTEEGIWVAAATDAELEELGAWCIGSDRLYREFHRLLVDGADEIAGKP